MDSHSGNSRILYRILEAVIFGIHCGFIVTDRIFFTAYLLIIRFQLTLRRADGILISALACAFALPGLAVLLLPRGYLLLQTLIFRLDSLIIQICRCPDSNNP